MEEKRIVELKKQWLEEEAIAHIKGWDFSHIAGRYSEEEDLPWDYRTVVDRYRTNDMKLLDYDTGGGEFLLSLDHPYGNTAATEGYAPNAALCGERLLPLGIDFRFCDDAENIPFADGAFDLFINRHGDLAPREIFRVLKPGGIFVTQQVGADNDRDLVRMVLPDAPVPFPEQRLDVQRRMFAEAGMEILEAEEAFRPIRFCDVGAFVWFARIIEWEFPGFSVETCFDRLLDLQKTIDAGGRIEGTIHRFLIAARRPSGRYSANIQQKQT